MNHPVAWSEVFNWLKIHTNQFLFGSVLGVMILVGVTFGIAAVIGSTIQPYALGLSMTIYNALLSTVKSTKQETLIKESICYYIATVIILFFGIGFEVPTNP